MTFHNNITQVNVFNFSSNLINFTVQTGRNKDLTVHSVQSSGIKMDVSNSSKDFVNEQILAPCKAHEKT